MFLLVIVILAIGLAIGLIFFLSKSKKSAITKPGTITEEKPFVFSSNKPFVSSRKNEKSKPIELKIKKPEIIKTEMPVAFSSKTEKPEIKKEPPKKKQPPAKNDAVKDSVKKRPSQSKTDDNGVDFDRLSDLIEDFFADDVDPKDFR